MLQGERIEVGFTSGAVTLLSTRGELRIDVPGPLPETVCAGSLQRRVGDVLGHDLLDGRDYPISRVTQHPDRTVIHARTGDALYDMPWPDLVDV